MEECNVSDLFNAIVSLPPEERQKLCRHAKVLIKAQEKKKKTFHPEFVTN